MREADLQAQQLREAIMGGWRTRLIYQGVQSGLIDALGPEPRPADSLAAELGLHPGTVLRVLRALATLGLCEHTCADRFAETPLGARLREGAPDSMRGLALHWGGRVMEMLQTVEQTLATGEPGMGNGDFAALTGDAVKSGTFYRAMAEQSLPVARALVQAHDFSRYSTVMDVGGGYGAVLAVVLGAVPSLQGTIYDLAGLADGALRYAREAGTADRTRFVSGSFFDSVPGGADCIILKFILHDWPDPDAASVLANCRAALPAGGKMLMVEKLLPETVGPADESVVRSDLIMMPISGKERTLAEYQQMAADAGFAYSRHIFLDDDCWLVEVQAV